MQKNILGSSMVLSILVLVTAACVSSQAPISSSPTLSAVTGAQASTQAAEPVSSAQPAGTSTSSGGSLGGGSILLVVVPGKSQALYKVREQLASVSLPTDAIGKTQVISGTIAVKPDGTLDAAVSKFTVGLDSLQTDQSMRDNYVRRSILQTSQFPTAVFVPTLISGLPASLPTAGSVTFKLTGVMTIRDVTKPITWDVTGTIQGDQLSATATTQFKFEDFNLAQPHVPVVLSVVDQINLEMDMVLQRSQP
jgi:polyisoprenoid-binding protein YceI